MSGPAPFRSTKAAVKLHTLRDLRGNIPTFIHISDGKMHEVNILDQLLPEPGAFYIMDRGFLGFERLYLFHEAGSFFVTRGKSNLIFGSKPFSAPRRTRSSRIGPRSRRTFGNEIQAGITGRCACALPRPRRTVHDGSVVVREPREVHYNTFVAKPAEFKMLFVEPSIIANAARELGQRGSFHFPPIAIKNDPYLFRVLYRKKRRPIDRAFVYSIFERDHPDCAERRVVDAFADAVLALDDSMPNSTYIDMCSRLPVNDPARITMPTLILRSYFTRSAPAYLGQDH